MRISNLRVPLMLIGVIWPLLAACNDEQNKVDLSDQIRKEVVVGLPITEVRAVFEKYKIEYSYLPVEKLTTFSISPAPETVKLTDINGRFVAVLRDIETSGLTKMSISIQVDIDKNDVVSHVKIEPVYTAP